METRSVDLRRHQEMEDFWLCLSEERRIREGSPLPSFADFRLMDLPSRLIRGTVLIDLGVAVACPEAAKRPYFRFAGETHYNMLGFECTRHFLDELRLGPALLEWQDILAQVAACKTPLRGQLPFRNGAGRDLVIHWLRLPLSLDGAVVDMVLGYDIFTGASGLPPVPLTRRPA
jgi:hypothetical protein